MRCFFIVFVLAISCLGDGVMVQANVDNFYPTRFHQNLPNTIELQGLEISLDYLYKNKYLFGIGLGPLFMNGNVIGNNDFAVNIDWAVGKWLNFYYVIDWREIRTLVCLGGKVGEVSAIYRISNPGNYSLGFHAYEVREAYYVALGPKLMFGFKHFRLYGGGFFNFGKHTEINEKIDHYHTIVSETNSRFAVSTQVEFGLVGFIGR
jgi:hypothetical protein